MNPRHQNGKNCMVNIKPLIIFLGFFLDCLKMVRILHLHLHFSFEIRPNNHEIDTLHLCDTVCFSNLFLYFVPEPDKTIELWRSFLYNGRSNIR
jgi:hypothetical protein